ncbi:MAG: hypothetical protein QXZ20_01770 [Candidatus Aenigmatarchaeota archaeon]
MEIFEKNYELIKKYLWAGKIRFISSIILFVFLLVLKFFGGYTYLNLTFISLILIEAILNQPYNFFLKRVNIFRFQYYQMLVDIIIISWILYYMGGLSAPVISIAYYAVILWAGVVAGISAVVFACLVCSFFFSLVILGEHFGFFLHTVFKTNNFSTEEVFSLLLANIAFLFAFGYFSARSSKIIKELQRRRQEESLLYNHRLSITGFLLNQVMHSLQNYLATIKAGTQLLESINNKTEEIKIIEIIEESEKKINNLISNLANFSKIPNEEASLVNLDELIEDVLNFLLPFINYSNISINKNIGKALPLIKVNKDLIKEVFLALISRSLKIASFLPEGYRVQINIDAFLKIKTIEIIFSSKLVYDRLEEFEKNFKISGIQKEFEAILSLITSIIEKCNGKIKVEKKFMDQDAIIINLPFNLKK